MGENFHWGHTCPGAMSTSESVSRPETIPTSSPIIHTVDEEFNIKNDFFGLQYWNFKIVTLAKISGEKLS